MGRAHRTRRPRVCAKQMQAGPLQSSYGTAPETAPGVGMQRRARCSTRSTGTSLCASEGQVGVGGRPPVSTGDTQGVSRVLLSVTPDHSPQGGGGAGKSEGGRSRGGERERENTSNRAALSSLIVQASLSAPARPEVWEEAQASSHLPVRSDPCLPRPFILSIPQLPPQKIHSPLDAWLLTDIL